MSLLKESILIFVEMYNKQALLLEIGYKKSKFKLDKALFSNIIKQKQQANPEIDYDENVILKTHFNKIARVIDKIVSQENLNSSEEEIKTLLEEAFGTSDFHKFITEKKLETSWGNNRIQGIRSEILTKRDGEDQSVILGYHMGLHINYCDMNQKEKYLSLELSKEDIDILIEVLMDTATKINEFNEKE